MQENKKTNRPNVEKLAAFINKQPNPHEFATALLVIASLKPRTQGSAKPTGPLPISVEVAI